MDKLLTVGLVISAATGAASQALGRLRKDAESLNKSVAAIGAGRQAIDRVGKLRDGLAQAQDRAEKTHLAAQRMGEKLTTAQGAVGRLSGKLADANAQAKLTDSTIAHTASALQLSRDRAESLRLQLALAKGAGAAGAAEMGNLRLGIARAGNEAERLTKELDKARQRQAATQAETERLQAGLTRAQGIAGGLAKEVGASENRSRAARRELDNVGASLSRAEENARRLGLRLDDIQRTSRSLAQMERAAQLRQSGRQDIERGRQLRAEARSGVVETAAVGYSLLKPVSAFAKYEDAVKNIAITGEMSTQEEASLARDIRGNALRYNQHHDAVAKAVETLVAEGMEGDVAARQSGLLAKTSTATRASPEDLARMNVSFQKVFEVSDMEKAFSQAAKAGKLGSFELRDMAKWLPELGAYSKGIGLKGNEAVVSLAARLQVAKLGAGSNDAGANNLKNFLAKLTSVDTQKDFSKLDVDLTGELRKQAASGKDPITAGIDIILAQMRKAAPAAAAEMKKIADDVAKIDDPTERAAEMERRRGMIEALGQRAGLGTMFQDMQAVSYILAEIQNRPKLTEILEEVRTGTGKSGKAVIDEDFEKRMAGTSEKFKALSIAATDLLISVGGALAPTVVDLSASLKSATGWVTRMSDQYPRLVSAIGTTVGVLMAFSIARIATKWIAGGALSAIGAGKGLLGWLTGAKAAKDIQRVYVVNMGVGGGPDLGGGGADGRSGRRGRLRRAGGSLGRGLSRAAGAMGGIGRSALSLLGNSPGFWAAMRGAGKILAPLGLAMAAGDAFSAVSDPTLSARERQRGFGSAAGGFLGGLTGGALAGAAAGSIVPGIGTAVGGVVGGLLGAAGGSQIGGWLASQIDIGKVKETWVSAKSEFREGVSYVRGLVPDFSQAGSDIMAGLARGIESGFAWVDSAVSGMATAIERRFKGLLGIQSPSRVFAELGTFVSEGAALGIHTSSGMATNAAAALAAGIVAAASPGQSLAQQWANNGLPAWVTAAAGGAGGAAAGGGGQPQPLVITYAPQITVEAGADAQAVDAAVHRATRSAFAEFERHFDRLMADRGRRSYDYGGA